MKIVRWKLSAVLILCGLILAGLLDKGEYLSRHFPVMIGNQPSWFSITLIQVMGWQETRWYPGFTPVMLAARAGNVQVVRKLIEMKIDLNAVDDLDGRNALMFAILNGHNKVANYLIEAGADLNVIDYRGQTSLDHAKNAKNIDLIRLISAELSASR